jgi:hypothetical protein
VISECERIQAFVSCALPPLSRAHQGISLSIAWNPSGLLHIDIKTICGVGWKQAAVGNERVC